MINWLFKNREFRELLAELSSRVINIETTLDIFGCKINKVGEDVVKTSDEVINLSICAEKAYKECFDLIQDLNERINNLAEQNERLELLLEEAAE